MGIVLSSIFSRQMAPFVLFLQVPITPAFMSHKRVRKGGVMGQLDSRIAGPLTLLGPE